MPTASLCVPHPLETVSPVLRHYPLNASTEKSRPNQLYLLNYFSYKYSPTGQRPDFRLLVAEHEPACCAGTEAVLSLNATKPVISMNTL